MLTDDLKINMERILAMDEDTLRRAIEDAVVRAKAEGKGEHLGFLIGVLASQPERMPRDHPRRAIFDEGLSQLEALHAGGVRALADQFDGQVELLRKSGVDGLTGANPYREWLWQRELVPDKRPGVSFSEALAALKRGERVARAGWNGKGMWLRLESPDAFIGTLDGALSDVRVLRGFRLLDGTYVQVRPYITLKTADDGLVPWVASQTDLLAEDWEVLTHG